MKHCLLRLAFTAVLGAIVAGCVTAPGDPYYQAPGYAVYEQPGYVYGSGTVYRAPPGSTVYPYGTVPAPLYYGGRDRWDDDRHRDRWWREREHDRDREARDRREQLARDADRRAREQAERDRRAAESRRPEYQPPRQLAPGSYTPHPQDWRSRQQSNSLEQP